MAILSNLFNQKKEDGSVSQAPVVNNTVSGGIDPQKMQDFSSLGHLDSRTSQILTHAQQEAIRVHLEHINPEQLLFGLLYDEEIFKLLESFSVDVARLSSEIQNKEIIGSFTGEPSLSESAKEIVNTAYLSTRKRGAALVSPEDILLTLFNSSLSSTYLTSTGLNKEAVEKKISTQVNGFEKKSVLETYAVDLTREASENKLDPVAGRESEIDRLIHILLRRSKNNPIVIGEAGVGKTAVVEGLAQKISAGNIPHDLVGKRIFQLDLAALVAGASHRGEFEERFKAVINECLASQGKIILFIDEIHTLIGTGEQEGSIDASNILKPYLARGQIQIIGTSTTVEYRKHFEKDKAFERRFQPVLVDEPDEEKALEMLKVLRSKYENFHKVTIPDETLKAAIKLSKRYIGERLLPDKAVDLIDEASADVKLRLSKDPNAVNSVTESDIQNVVSSWTGIPITRLTEDESQKLLQLEERIHKRLIDQKEAVEAVAQAVRRGRIGLSSSSRPIASFVFLGPTGVGKTELAKTLAEILFGRDDAMIRLDMSEYMEKHEVAKLIGSPPGYVGYDEGGQLTEAVRTKPYSIVLFDEIEKAHPDVFNILLQLLDDGRLTDNKGNTISFKNTIIICTSNIGSVLIQEELTKQNTTVDFQNLKKIVQNELVKFFRPELLNRFDETVIFKPLRREDMSAIAKLGIDRTNKLLQDQGFGLSISDIALSQLASEGYDPVYGARPLRRLIQTAIENPISVLIINKTFVKGDQIVIDFDPTSNQFIFNKKVETQLPAQDNGEIKNPVPSSPLIPPQPSFPQNNLGGSQLGADGTQMQKDPSTEH